MAVVDSASLIYLTKSSCKEILVKTYSQVSITPAVYREVVVGGKRYPDSGVVEKNVKEGRIRVENPSKILSVYPNNLGAGEMEALSLAFEKKAMLITDDVHAIRAALLHGVHVRTSETVLIEAYIRGVISRLEDLKDKLTALIKHKAVRPDVYVLITTLLKVLEEERGEG